jgi:hypothetical protein
VGSGWRDLSLVFGLRRFRHRTVLGFGQHPIVLGLSQHPLVLSLGQRALVLGLGAPMFLPDEGLVDPDFLDDDGQGQGEHCDDHHNRPQMYAGLSHGSVLDLSIR